MLVHTFETHRFGEFDFASQSIVVGGVLPVSGQ